MWRGALEAGVFAVVAIGCGTNHPGTPAGVASLDPIAAPDARRAAPPDAAPPDATPPQVPAPLPRAPTIDLAFAGDVMFGRYIRAGFKPIPADVNDPFAAIDPLLRSDFTMVNLETTVMGEPPAKSPYGTLMRFVAPPRRVAVLPAHGIGNVTIANNHWYDMRAEGVRETPLRLAELGIRAFGAARLDHAITVESVDVQGWKVGIIAAAAIVNHDPVTGEPSVPYRQSDDLIAPVAALLAGARADHDVLIVAVHWGHEYKDVPESSRIKAGHAWIDAGANAVIGHHPHVLQGIEQYGLGFIAYSLGNLLFDNLNPLRRDGGVLRLTFQPHGVRNACVRAARFSPTGLVRDPSIVVKPAAALGTRDRITQRLARLSRQAPLRTAWTDDGDDLVSGTTCPRDPPRRVAPGSPP